MFGFQPNGIGTITTANMNGIVGNSPVSTTAGLASNMIFAMGYNDYPRAVKGIIVPRAANLAGSETVNWNGSLWTNVINTNDWNPGALVHANAWGTGQTTVVAGAIRATTIPFVGTITLPQGYFFFGVTYRCNTALTAGSFYTVATYRVEGVLNGATAGYAKYDQYGFNRTTGASTTASGTNGTNNILVASSASFSVNDVIRAETSDSYKYVTAVPDGTHITLSSTLTTTNGEVIRKVTGVAYAATTPSANLTNLTLLDNATYGTAAPQNINFGLWCEV
jgi:hypothetical protein